MDEHRTQEPNESAVDLGLNGNDGVDADRALATQALANPVRNSKLHYIIPLVALLIFVFFALVGSIVSLGNQLMDAHVVLGTIYYVFIGLCVAAGIVYPIVRTLAYPVFGLWHLTSGDERSRQKYAKKVANNLAQRAELPGIDRTELVQVSQWTPQRLATTYENMLTPVLNQHIKQAVKSSFITTAISQNTAIDMLSVLSINIRLIQDEVRACGFRPTLAGMGALYARVLKTTLIAGGLEEMDYAELISLMGGNSVLQAGGIVMASAGTGMTNAFFTARVGIITKAFLLDQNQRDIKLLRRTSYGEALRFLKNCGLIEDVRDASVRQAKKAVHAAGEKITKAKDNAIERGSHAIESARKGTVQAVKDTGKKTSRALKGAGQKTTQVLQNVGRKTTGTLRRTKSLPDGADEE